MKYSKKLPILFAFAALFFSLTFTGSVSAGQTKAVKGQTLYVPVYTYIYYGDREGKIKLTATLSIRNISPDAPLKITTIDYVGSDGKKIRSYVKEPITLAPLTATRYLVKESDLEGGLGTSFIVTWQSGNPIPPPVVQAVMIGAESTQGISFVTNGRVITEIE